MGLSIYDEGKSEQLVKRHTFGQIEGWEGYLVEVHSG
jgi:hypothetical protein